MRRSLFGEVAKHNAEIVTRHGRFESRVGPTTREELGDGEMKTFIVKTSFASGDWDEERFSTREEAEGHRDDVLCHEEWCQREGWDGYNVESCEITEEEVS